MADRRRFGKSGFTFIEIAVALGIVALLFAIALPFFVRYRGQSSVNRAVEISKAVIERAVEEAKSSGHPLPDQVLQNGLETASSPESTPEKSIAVRIRKRTSPAGPAAIITQRELPRSNSFTAHFHQLGLIDLGSDPTLLGVYAEFVETSGTTETVLATLPIDVNGEIVLLGKAGNAFVSFRFGSYARQIELTSRGVVTMDRR